MANRLISFGHRCFAIALIAFGLQQFVVGDVVVGRAPAFPSGVPGRMVWAYASAVILVGAGAAIMAGVWARRTAILAGVMIAVWALARLLPLVVADHSIGGVWTNAGKALALSGGALAVAGSLPRERGSATLVAIGTYCLAAFMVLAGIQHFLFPAFVKLLVPAWIPGPLLWTYFAGVALIAGGLGLLVRATARLAAAASGLMVFSWLVMLHIPRALAAAPGQGRNEWTAVFEALAVSGIAFTLAGAAARAQQPGRRTIHGEVAVRG